MNIEKDVTRFKKIITGKIRQNLKKYISKGEMIGRVGKDKVSIPVSDINLPRFKFDDGKFGGIGHGDGDIGDAIGQNGQPGNGKAGSNSGEHVIEVEVSIDELAQILGEELCLPNIQPKGKSNIDKIGYKYTDISNAGSDSLRHNKRSFKEALKRQIITNTFDPNDPVIIPQKSDMRYKYPNVIVKPDAKAVIIYMMDVSGSMGEEQKEIARTLSFWIDIWLKKQYKGLETRFIIHDSSAKEVDKDTFFSTKESGGTMISSAYKLCKQIIEKDYISSEWNCYPIHFSDGDNWSDQDTNICLKLIDEYFIHNVNQFAYAQVKSQAGSGQFIEDLKVNFKDDGSYPEIVLSELESKDDILKCIKKFFSAGR